MLLPVPRPIEPGESPGEGRIVPAAGDPRRVMHHAQGAQGFREPELRGVEVRELLVALQYRTQLQLHLATLAREQHPQVLHCGTGAAVVEVHEVGAVVGPEDVARVAVAMEPDGGDVAGALVTPADAGQ